MQKVQDRADILFIPFTATSQNSFQIVFGNEILVLYVLRFRHIHTKTPRGIVLCEQLHADTDKKGKPKLGLAINKKQCYNNND